MPWSYVVNRANHRDRSNLIIVRLQSEHRWQILLDAWAPINISLHVCFKQYHVISQTVVATDHTNTYNIVKGIGAPNSCTLNCDDRYVCVLSWRKYWHTHTTINYSSSYFVYWFQMSIRLQLVALHCFYCKDLYKTNKQINERTNNYKEVGFEDWI